MQVVVGSNNPAKVGAAEAMLKRAFPGCRVVSMDVPSQVPEQPLGAEQTAAGARARARGALAAVPGADMGIGLEGGLDPVAGELINCCCVATPDREGVAWGVRFPLPPAVVAQVLAGAELGPVMDEISGIPESKRSLGAVGILTAGLLSRTEMWQSAIACALAPHLHPELYGQAPAVTAAAPGASAEVGGPGRATAGAAPASAAPVSAAPAPVTRDFTVATFVLHRGKVLLLYHRKLQMWLPPGGHIDPNELPDEAVVREVLEETGLAVELVSAPAMTGVPGPLHLARPEGVQLEDIAPGHQHIDLIYYARPAGGLEPVLNAAESEAVGWYGPADFDRLGMTEEVRAWALRALTAVQ